MTANSDSRPFIDLRRNAEEFRTEFDEDVLTCLDLLESKLSTLIRDPDSLESPQKEAKRLGAHVEFSKAKLEIFLSVKSEVERTQSAWKEKIDRMVNSFLENVEILLASTTLETDFSHHGNQIASKNRKSIKDSSVITTSINASYSLINSAKKLPSVINSFLSQDNEDEELDNEDRLQSIQDNSSDEEDEEELPKSYVLPTRKSSVTSSPVKQNAVKPFGKKEIQERPISTRRGAIVKESVSNETVKTTPSKAKSGRGKKSILKLDHSNNNELHATPSRSTRNRTAVKESIPGVFEEEQECIEIDEDTSAAPKTPKNVHFSVGLDVEEDLEIYSPVVNLTRSAPRRKTVIIPEDTFSDFNLTPNVSRAKRKTIGGSVMDVSVAPSPKRLKRGRASMKPAISEEKEDHLESDDPTVAEHYSPWILLEDLDANVPAQPGVYELKVYKAKKSAYIGSCDNLRQKLTLHKLGQSSGHKHLDKFLDRNKREVQVRYERIPSAAAAKNEEMNRIKAFVSQHRTTPAYN